MPTRQLSKNGAHLWIGAILGVRRKRYKIGSDRYTPTGDAQITRFAYRCSPGACRTARGARENVQRIRFTDYRNATSNRRYRTPGGGVS